jgi:hypothetical protein
MTLRLNGSTSGYTEIDAPAVAGNNNLKLPTGNGSDGNILGTDGAGNLSWVNGRMVLATAQNTTSGTSIDFTGIPSWVKRVTVMFNGVSTSGTSNYAVQIGTSAGIATSGYVSATTFLQAGALGSATSTSNFIIYNDSANTFTYGALSLALFGSNVWMASGVLFKDNSATDYIIPSSGSIALSGTLDRLRLTTPSGTDTFDAGSINILYEG